MTLTPGPDHFLALGAILFTLGVIGVLTRRDPLIIFMSIELMLNSVNLTFATFSQTLGSADGQIFVFIIMTVAAAEVVVGLALIVSIFQTRQQIDVDELDEMRG
jgi:NADH-quinone oxidoreductase subunit K